MSKYTTGEIAKLCGVSVRTVQYYDTRGILVPSATTDGGRRLYSEGDLGRMKIICYLRDLGLPIDSIKKLFCEDNFENVLSLLLDEQQRMLLAELSEKQKQVDRISETKRALTRMENISVGTIKDIAHVMDNKKKLRRVRTAVVAIGLVMDAIQVATLMLWILKGVWIPYLVGMTVSILLGVFASKIYFTNTAYICPECHEVFKPKLKDVLFARHTPNTRKTTCTKCNYKGFCVETYGGRNAED